MQMTARSPEDAIRKFVAEIKSDRLHSGFEKLLELISGPLSIVKAKLKVIDSVVDPRDFIPGISPEFKDDLRRVVEETYEEAFETALSYLKDIEKGIDNLETISETFSQRILEGIRSQNSLVTNNRELLACHEDCRQVLIYFRLKARILQYYLQTPYQNQADIVPLEQLNFYEDTVHNLISRLQNI